MRFIDITTLQYPESRDYFFPSFSRRLESNYSFNPYLFSDIFSLFISLRRLFTQTDLLINSSLTLPYLDRLSSSIIHFSVILIFYISWKKSSSAYLYLLVLFKALILSNPFMRSSLIFKGIFCFSSQAFVLISSMYIKFFSFFLYFSDFTNSIFFMIKTSLIKEVKVLWIPCMNINTKLNIYAIVKITLFFYKIACVIIYIESPIIKQTNVVTLSDNVPKKLTFGNRHIPNKAYEMNTGKNYTKNFITFVMDSLISSYIRTSFLYCLINLKMVNQENRQVIPAILYLSMPETKYKAVIIAKTLLKVLNIRSNYKIWKQCSSLIQDKVMWFVLTQLCT